MNRIPRGIERDDVSANQSGGSRFALGYLINKSVGEIVYFVRTLLTSTVLRHISTRQKAAHDYDPAE